MTDTIKAIALETTKHPKPLTLKDLEPYNLIYSAPPGFPRLTEKQAKLVKIRAANPSMTWKAVMAQAGYKVSSQNSGRAVIGQDVQMYLDAISHGEALAESVNVGTPAELRAAAIRTLASALSDPDARNGTLAAKILLDALPATDASDVSVLAMSDDDLRSKIEQTIRELGDLDLRLAVCVPPEPIAAPVERQVAPDMEPLGPSPIDAERSSVDAQAALPMDMPADDEQGGGSNDGADPPKTDLD